jgi:hypothetical protein
MAIMILYPVPWKDCLARVLKAFLFYFFIICIPLTSFPQEKDPLFNKFSLTLQGMIMYKQHEQRSTFVIAVSDVSLFKTFL